jgi:hypothetical protein
MSFEGMSKVYLGIIPLMLGFNANWLLEQHKMDHTGFLLEMKPLSNTARFFISGCMRS